MRRSVHTTGAPSVLRESPEAAALLDFLDGTPSYRYGPLTMRTLENPAPISPRPHALFSLRALKRRFAVPALAALLATGAAGAITLAPSTAAAQSAPKIAVVDVRRAVLETEEGLRVQATLKKLFDSRQVELENKQRALGQEKEDLDREAQAGKSSKEALQRKFEALQKRAVELQGLTVDYQREMQRKEGELTTPILQRVMAIVRRIAAQDGYEMILEKSAVPYFRGDLEITDKTIQMYNSGQTGDVGAPGAPAGKAPAAPAASGQQGSTPKPAPAAGKPPASAPAPAPKKK